MIPNIDPETGVHYGVHSANSIDNEMLDEFDLIYSSSCPHCGHELGMEEEKCRCGEYIEDMELEAIGAAYEKDGYVIQHNYDDNWIWVFKSPYITYCRLCSPCASNAGDLETPDRSGVVTYCLDSSFFVDDKAPYRYEKIQEA